MKTIMTVTIIALLLLGACATQPMDTAGQNIQQNLTQNITPANNSDFLPFVREPVVYLYPTADGPVNVRLRINGQLIEDEPAYHDGWNVYVTTDGRIDGRYDYLIYEAKLNEIELPAAGWVVKHDGLKGWFDTELIRLGLNEKEKEQFESYWLKRLPKSEYYEIRLLGNQYLEENMGLIVSPQPTTMIRLDFYFKPLEKKVTLEEPAITTPTRKGFTVVEWGGILAD